MQRLLTGTAAFGLVAALTINGTYHLAKYLTDGNALVLSFQRVASPFSKDPLSLAYLLFYGALGVGLLSSSVYVLKRGYVPWLTSRATALGQTSFVVFVLQFYVYFTGLALVRERLPFRSAWPAYFGGSVAVIMLVAFAWHRRGYNRFLTVGYRRMKEARWNVPLRFGKDAGASGRYPQNSSSSSSLVSQP
jgi:hypothetical protein